jgi:HPt (histidine-containing phosphotransfer) domain-containing protein
LQLTTPTEPFVPFPAPPAWGVLDAAAVARLQELDPGGNAGLLTRVLATYTQSLQRLLAQLRAARQDADLQGQHHVVHTLKSSSASVGALKLAALCADVERRLRDGALDGLGAQLDDLAAEGEHVLGALRQG